jgi:hypothetical protein
VGCALPAAEFKTGTLLGTPAAGAGGALSATALTLLGKKVALWPLWICHWSQSKTNEKPKTTHKMVRRISFMKISYEWKRK